MTSVPPNPPNSPLPTGPIVRIAPNTLSFNTPTALATINSSRKAPVRKAPWYLTIDARSKACKPGDLAILVYTSGTTGKPKGAMHSHAGLVYTMHGYNTLVGQNEQDERMCFLPLCHIAERLGGEYHALYTGAKLNFVENPETVPENVREIAPTVFTAVPRVWDKFYSGVMISLESRSPAPLRASSPTGSDSATRPMPTKSSTWW